MGVSLSSTQLSVHFHWSLGWLEDGGDIFLLNIVLRLRMEEMASRLEGSCKYTEYAVKDSRQGVVLHLGGWEWG
jgi:hypothetical protein